MTEFSLQPLSPSVKVRPQFRSAARDISCLALRSYLVFWSRLAPGSVGTSSASGPASVVVVLFEVEAFFLCCRICFSAC